eukprot:XP_014786417.1 PREDICTED: uncharacterized protein LOC106880806 isoform X3 [Octopus bimaculoides]
MRAMATSHGYDISIQTRPDTYPQLNPVTTPSAERVPDYMDSPRENLMPVCNGPNTTLPSTSWPMFAGNHRAVMRNCAAAATALPASWPTTNFYAWCDPANYGNVPLK